MDNKNIESQTPAVGFDITKTVSSKDNHKVNNEEKKLKEWLKNNNLADQEYMLELDDMGHEWFIFDLEVIPPITSTGCVPLPVLNNFLKDIKNFPEGIHIRIHGTRYAGRYTGDKYNIIFNNITEINNNIHIQIDSNHAIFNNLKKITSKCTIEGSDIEMNSLEYLSPECVIFSNDSLYLNSLENLPSSWDNVIVRRDLHLNGVKRIKESFSVKVGENLYLENLEDINDCPYFHPVVGRKLYLHSLKSIPKNDKKTKRFDPVIWQGVILNNKIDNFKISYFKKGPVIIVLWDKWLNKLDKIILNPVNNRMHELEMYSFFEWHVYNTYNDCGEKDLFFKLFPYGIYLVKSINYYEDQDLKKSFIIRDIFSNGRLLPGAIETKERLFQLEDYN